MYEKKNKYQPVHITEDKWFMYIWLRLQSYFILVHSPSKSWLQVYY